VSWLFAISERSGHNPLFDLLNIHDMPKEEVNLGRKREPLITFIGLDGPGIESCWD
jgi:hypothetical protein